MGDLQALIEQFLGPTRAALAASEAGRQANQHASIFSALMNPGSVPDSFAGNLSQAEQQQIQNNPYSYMKQAGQAQAISQRNFGNSLAARGIYSSGELPYQLGQLGNKYNLAINQQQGATPERLNSLLSGNAAANANDQFSLSKAGMGLLPQLMAMFGSSYDGGGGTGPGASAADNATSYGGGYGYASPPTATPGFAYYSNPGGYGGDINQYLGAPQYARGTGLNAAYGLGAFSPAA